MAQAENEGVGRFVLFVITWYALSNYAPLENWAFLSTSFLWLVGWLAIKLAGRASFRLGAKAWGLMVQVALWFLLFLWLAPVTETTKIVLVWGVGIPLIIAGAALRVLHAKFSQFQHPIERAPLIAACAIMLGTPLLCRINGFGFWYGLLAAAGLCIMGAVPAYYGWCLGQPLARGARDARFGGEEDYRDAGMFDER